MHAGFKIRHSSLEGNYEHQSNKRASVQHPHVVLAMAQQQAALLTISSEQLSRILLPAGSDVSALLLAARVNAIQPGGAVAACRTSETCVQLLCAKVSAARYA